MSLDEGIKSTDVGTIKAARGIAKGLVTDEYISNLRDSLVVDSARSKKIADLANELKIAKAELESKKKAASRVVKSSDEYHRAGQMREELSKAFSNYDSKLTEYRHALIIAKFIATEEKFAPAEDESEIIRG